MANLGYIQNYNTTRKQVNWIAACPATHPYGKFEHEVMGYAKRGIHASDKVNVNQDGYWKASGNSFRPVAPPGSSYTDKNEELLSHLSPSMFVTTFDNFQDNGARMTQVVYATFESLSLSHSGKANVLFHDGHVEATRSACSRTFSACVDPVSQTKRLWVGP
jgi:prepilin-type processing-associated H-X9-DG protein